MSVQSIAVPYKASISYSHAADSMLAPRLQSALHQLARPWYAFRAMRTFRDETTLALTPALWPRIVRALDGSEYFVLLASPAAAFSHWVIDEVIYWLATKDSKKLLLVITDGKLRWDSSVGDFDWRATNCLPSALRGRFEAEPLYCDLTWARSLSDLSLNNPRFKNDVATLAAALHGCDKDELIGEDVEQRRRLNLAKRLGVSVIVALLLLASIAAWIANRERLLKESQRRLAVARQLAAESQLDLLRPSGLTQRSVLLSLESLDAALTTEGFDSWMAGMVRLPSLERVLLTERPVSDLRFTPTGRRLVTTDGRGTATLWDLDTGREVRRFRHASRISFWHLGRKGVLTTAVGPSVFVWDLESGKRAARLRHTTAILAAEYSTNGESLAVSEASGDITLWSTATWRPIVKSRVTLGVTTISFHPRKRLLALGGPGGTYLWNPSASFPDPLLRPSTHGISQPSGATSSSDSLAIAFDVMQNAFAAPEDTQRVLFSPSGRFLAVGSRNGHVFVFAEAGGWRKLAQFRRRARGIDQIEFLPDETALLARSLSGTILVCDLRIKEVVRAIRAGGLVGEMLLTGDGRRLLTGSADGTVQVWDVATGDEVSRADGIGPIRALDYHQPTQRIAFADSGMRLQLRKLAHHELSTPIARGFLSQVFSVDLSPDGRLLAASGDPFLVRAWNYADGKELFKRFLTGLAIPLQVLFSPDSTRLAAAAGDAGAILWRIQGDEEIGAFTHPGANVLAVAFDIDGRLLLTGGDDGKVKAWRVSERRELYEVASESGVWSLAHHPQQNLFAVGSTDGVVIRRTSDGKEDRRFPMTGAVTALRFNPDGERLAMGNNAGLIQVVQMDSGELVLTGQHSEEVRSLRFSRDGRYLLSTSGSIAVQMRVTGDSSIRLWDLESGTQILRIGQDWPIGGAVLDGKGRIVGTRRAGLERWEWSLPDITRLACAQLSRNFTRSEWRRLFGNRPYNRTCAALPGHETLLGDAATLMGQGKTVAAEEELTKVLREVPEFDFNPRQHLRTVAAELSLARAGEALQDRRDSGWVERMRGALREARRLDPALWIDAQLLNGLCWYGSLAGQAAAVLAECDLAVAADPEEPAFRDSRGVARALTGDHAGAIEDFSLFVVSNQGSSDAHRRALWIESLRQERSPFSAEELAFLRGEEEEATPPDK